MLGLGGLKLLWCVGALPGLLAARSWEGGAVTVCGLTFWGLLIEEETPMWPPLAVLLRILIGPFLKDERIDLPWFCCPFDLLMLDICPSELLFLITILWLLLKTCPLLAPYVEVVVEVGFPLFAGFCYWYLTFAFCVAVPIFDLVLIAPTWPWVDWLIGTWPAAYLGADPGLTPLVFIPLVVV